MKILVAEDNENSRVLLTSFLELSGYTVESAANGAQALACAHTFQPDLVISDILMPEMDGFALCREIKSDAHLRHIPFVFYTATYTDPEDEIFAIDLGASKFLIKPMEMAQLRQEIEEVLNTGQGPPQSVPDRTLKPEGEINRDHVDALIRKLDKKVKELESEKRKLIKSERKYRRLVEALRDDYFFFTLDTAGLVRYVSPSVTNVLGYSQQEMRGAFMDYLTDNPLNHAAREHFQEALAGYKQATFETELRHQNGATCHLEITQDPVLDSRGRIEAVEGVAHDITPRIRSEQKNRELAERLEQVQKMEAIGTLAGGIAHDFNNILTPILGYTDIVANNLPQDHEHRYYLTEVLTAATRAKALVKQILTFSRRAKEEERKPLELQPIVKETLTLMRSTIPATIEIREDIDTASGPVMANPTQIHQLLMNLCTNAYHAMRDTGGVLGVTIDTLTLDPEDYVTDLDLVPGRYVRLTVSDTGGGIDPQIQKRIFEPYFTTKPKDEGTGLGLAVVHGIVKSHGGNITLYSEPGQGTCFRVFLPLVRSLRDDTEIPDTPVPRGNREHILLVEDEGMNLNMMQHMLEILGYRVTGLSDGSVALEKFRASPGAYDLVITDMTMPGMTGAELARHLLEIRPGLPVVLCSGFSEIINEKKAKALGIREYLMKPIVKKDLAQAVRRVLDA